MQRTIFMILSGNLFDGLWLAFIGWFLETAAVAQIHHQTLHDMLASHKVIDALNPDIQPVTADTSIQELIDKQIVGKRHRYFLVRQHARPVGLLTLQRISEIPREKRMETHISDIMIPQAEVKEVDYQDNLWSAFKEMEQDGVNQLLVMEDHKIAGILSRHGILSFIRDLQELDV